jgi:predicted Zn-ribbon and HTH transcriptional regulator
METTEEMLMQELKCLRCGYKWFPKPGRGKPKVCGRCKSFNWSKPRLRRVVKDAA